MKKVEVYIDGRNSFSAPENAIIGTFLGVFIDDIGIRSGESIKGLISGILDLAEELCPGAQVGKQIYYGRKVLENFTKEKGLFYIADSFLSSEKLGVLYGFGLAICERNESGGRTVKRRILINPEKFAVLRGD